MEALPQFRFPPLPPTHLHSLPLHSLRLRFRVFWRFFSGEVLRQPALQRFFSLRVSVSQPNPQRWVGQVGQVPRKTVETKTKHKDRFGQGTLDTLNLSGLDADHRSFLGLNQNQCVAANHNTETDTGPSPTLTEKFTSFFEQKNPIATNGHPHPPRNRLPRLGSFFFVLQRIKFLVPIAIRKGAAMAETIIAERAGT